MSGLIFRILKWWDNKTKRLPDLTKKMMNYGALLVTVLGILGALFGGILQLVKSENAATINSPINSVVSGGSMTVHGDVNVGLNEQKIKEIVEDIARKKNVDADELRAILDKLGVQGVKDRDIAARLSEKADELIRTKFVSSLLTKAITEASDGLAEAAAATSASAFKELPSLETRSAFASAIFRVSPHLLKRFAIFEGGRTLTWADENTLIYMPLQASAPLQSIHVSKKLIISDQPRWTLPKVFRRQDNNLAAVSVMRVVASNRVIAIYDNSSLAVISRATDLIKPPIENVSLRADPNAASIGRGGQTAAAVSVNGGVIVTECDQPASTSSPPTCSMQLLRIDAKVVAISPDETKIAVGNTKGLISVYDTKGQRQGGSVQVEGSVTALDWADENQKQRLVVASSGNNGRAEITILDFFENANLTFVAKRSLEADGISVIVWHPQASEIYYPCRRFRICQSHTADGLISEPTELGNHRGDITRLSWSRDGNYLASLATDATVAIWTREQNQAGIYTLDSLDLSQLSILAGSPDGMWIATGGKDGDVSVWDAKSRQMQRTYKPSKNEAALQSLAWNRQGVLGALYSDGIIYLLSTDVAKSIRSIKTEGGHDSQIVFLNDTTIAFPQRGTNRITLLPLNESESAKFLHDDSIKGEPWGVAADTDGRLLFVSYSSGEIFRWDTTTHKSSKMLKLKLEAQENGAANSLSVSSNNQWLATSGSNHFVRVYEVQTGQSNVVLPTLEEISCVAFSPDARKLAAVDISGRVYVWSVKDQAFEQVLTFDSRATWNHRGGSNVGQPGCVSWVSNDTIAAAFDAAHLILFSLNEINWTARASSVTEGLTLSSSNP
jgi:WD40 repeat protein